MGTADAWQSRFARMRFSEVGALTVPKRRQRGADAAPGPFVAFLEDTSLPAPGWLAAIGQGFANESVAALGGPVRIDPALGPRSLALACTEYGRFHPDRVSRLARGVPDENGVQAVSRLPGNNLAYRRASLLEILRGIDHGLLESEVNGILLARGFSLALHPGMAVDYVAPDPRGLGLGTRFHHGRLYAGQRSSRWSYGARLAGAAGSLLLPAILSARSLAHMTRAVEPAAWLATAFWISLMETSWAAGETVGYLAGGEASLIEWR